MHKDNIGKQKSQLSKIAAMDSYRKYFQKLVEKQTQINAKNLTESELENPRRQGVTKNINL